MPGVSQRRDKRLGLSLLAVGPVGTRPQWVRHCSSCFAHKMGLIPCKPAGWAGEGGCKPRCKPRAGDKHGVIPAFWLSAVEYFSVFCADPSVHPAGRKAGVQDAPGAEGRPDTRCCAPSFGVKSREVSPDHPAGAGAPVWTQGSDQWGSHAGIALATVPSLGKFPVPLMGFGV